MLRGFVSGSLIAAITRKRRCSGKTRCLPTVRASPLWRSGISTGTSAGATRPNSLGITEDYTFGTIFLETPSNMGVTDFHYFVDPGPPTIPYLWPIITSDPTNPSIAATAANYFHGATAASMM